MQKLIQVDHKETSQIDNYISDGWVVESISACANSFTITCFVLLTKKEKDADIKLNQTREE